MNEQQQVAAALTGFAVLSVFGGGTLVLKQRAAARRLRQFVGIHTDRTDRSSTPFLKQQPDASPIVAGLNRRIGRSGLARQLQLQLVRAGLSVSANHFILGQIALASVLFLLGRWVLFSGESLTGLLLSLALALPVFLLPRFGLRFLQHRRVRRFEHQLAQAIDIMAGALQAGSSLAQSFELVSREMPPPIGAEFRRLMQEVRFGVPIEQALNNMLERVPSMDLEMLVTAINIQYRVGGSLGHILRTIAHTIRERVRIRGEIQTLTAQARLSSYIISAMPVLVVLALLVVSPTYILKLFEPGITRVLLISGIFGIISGFYVMKRIATIEV